MQEDNVRSLTPAADTGSQCESDINRNNVDLSSRGTSNIGNRTSSDVTENNRLVRMYLHPYYLWSRYMITPIRHQKQIPKTNPSLNFNSEQIDEWEMKIWPHLRGVVLQDNEIQDIRIERICICLIALLISGILQMSNHFIRTTGGVAVMIYAIAMYIQYGDRNIQLLNPQRRAIILNGCVLILLNGLVFFLSYASSFYYELLANKPHDYLDTIFLQSIYVYPVTIFYIVTITSCRDGVFCASFERQDKALKTLYYKVKTFEDTLTHFSLHPSIRFFNGDIAIDVYPKIKQSTVNVTVATEVLSSVEMPKNVDCAMTRTNDTDFGTGMNDPLLPRHHLPSHV